MLKELESLISRINEANLAAKLPDGRSLTVAIAHRDTLAAQHSLLLHAIASTHREPDRYSMSEIKWVAVLKVASLQRQVEILAKKIRETEYGHPGNELEGRTAGIRNTGPGERQTPAPGPRG